MSYNLEYKESALKEWKKLHGGIRKKIGGTAD
jgi:mRNA-degrading endonuclease RelE of RelBE toxin-antitoxin system